MFSNFYGKTYKSTGKKASEFNVAELEVDPHREGIKQSELWAKNYENVIKKRRANEGKRDWAQQLRERRIIIARQRLSATNNALTVMPAMYSSLR